MQGQFRLHNYAREALKGKVSTNILSSLTSVIDWRGAAIAAPSCVA